MTSVPRVAVLGAGLAGLATSAALGSAGYSVDLYEARAFPGGRATSWPVSGADGETGGVIDNCQHLLLRCCVNLLDLYQRLNATEKIRFYNEYFFIEPGGRTSVMKRGILPAPAHLAGSFFGLAFLDLSDKIAIARAMHAIPGEYRTRRDLDRITMLDWLYEKEQTPNAIERYWRQVLVSAINEELNQMAASHGLQVFWLGMLARNDAYEMGLAAVPLRDLYDEASLTRTGDVRIHHRSTVTEVESQGDSRIAAIHVVGRTRGSRLLRLLPAFRTTATVDARPSDRMECISALTDHRHSSLVRPPGHGSSPRDAARPHDSVDVQQARWPLRATGGQRFTIVDRDAARRSDRSGVT